MPRRFRGRFFSLLVTGAVFLSAVVGCEPKAGPGSTPKTPVLLYCSVDETLARIVLKRYEAQSGASVSTIFDSEAGKTTGLVNRIMREAQGSPRADVFWSSELFHTILLARRGLLEPYDSPAAGDIPSRFRDASRRWTAVAVRARVIAFDPKKIARADLPTRWEELADPRFASISTIANPLFGTTRGHTAAMFALWGPSKGRLFLNALRDGGALICDSNSAAVRAVVAGRAKIALTDTDDVWVARRSGDSLELRYLDMGDGGTLLVPCSVAVLRGGPNPVGARKLVDFLVSAEVERMLARSDSRHVPVRASLRRELGMDWPPESQVGFEAVADAMDEAAAAVREILIR